MEMVENKEDLKKDLKEKELFKRDAKGILSYVTPYIPWIGLACGAIYIGKHILRKKINKEEKGRRRKVKNFFHNVFFPNIPYLKSF